MKITEAIGEVIELHYSDGNDSGEYFVRGHVTYDEAAKAVTAHLFENDSDSACDDMTPEEYAADVELAPVASWCWARYRPVREGDYGIPDGMEFLFDDRSTPAPGWAKVTRILTRAEWQFREEQKAVKVEALARAWRLWPNAERIDVRNPWDWASRHLVVAEVTLRDARIDWKPWGHSSWAYPRDHRVPRIAWMERAGLTT